MAPQAGFRISYESVVYGPRFPHLFPQFLLVQENIYVIILRASNKTLETGIESI